MDEKLKLQKIEYYDLQAILRAMEDKGYKEERKVWREYVCEWGVSNDTIFWLGFNYYLCTDKEIEYEEYFKEVNKLLGLPEDNDGIMVKVSW